MVHKPKHKVHSFRGLLDDGGQDEINLERQNVNLAYRIVKLEIISSTPGQAADESIVQIWKEEQTSISTTAVTIDFSTPDLLGVGYWAAPAAGYHLDAIVIFDNTLFSRNIYVTHTNVGSAVACNYYLELEEVPVGAATLMQLKLGVARKLSLSENAPDA